MADKKTDDADKGAGPKIQETFLKERKVFLWGEVSDKSARDITEKLLYLEADAPGKEITFTSTLQVALSQLAWQYMTP